MRIKIKYTLVFIPLFLINACKPSINSQISYEQLMDLRSPLAQSLERYADTANCKKNTRHQHNSYLIMNNLWGEANLKKDSAHLCTFSKDSLFGWKWSVPIHAKGVIGFPAIRIGPGPWKSTKKLINEMPIRLDSIKNLSVTYATEMYIKNKTYNLAFDIWLNKNVPVSKSNITTEIMVWEDYYDFHSFGKKVDVLVSDFGTYDVMKGYLKNDKFEQDWQYYAFIRKTPRRSGTIDCKVFLDYLILNHDLEPSNYVTAVEFGNEIGDSSGFTLVKEFDFSLN